MRGTIRIVYSGSSCENPIVELRRCWIIAYTLFRDRSNVRFEAGTTSLAGSVEREASDGEAMVLAKRRVI